MLCRARRKDDGASVLLQRPLDAAPSAADIALLAREFEVLRSLTVANPGALNDLYLPGGGYEQMTSTGNWHAADLVARALQK